MRDGDQFWLEYEVGPHVLGIGNEPFMKPSGDGAQLVLEVGDFEEAITHLQAKGVTFAMEPSELPNCRAAIIIDLDGNRLGIHKRKQVAIGSAIERLTVRQIHSEVPAQVVFEAVRHRERGTGRAAERTRGRDGLARRSRDVEDAKLGRTQEPFDLRSDVGTPLTGEVRRGIVLFSDENPRIQQHVHR